MGIGEAGRSRRVYLIILVTALGYFVDLYDLILFSIVRVPSLEAIGVAKRDQLSQGTMLLNVQLCGMLLGGLLWGMLGDKRGRLSVLFASIFCYSAANLANAFVNSVPAYAVIRFLAGVGLAGEVGVGITLVSECMPRESRGYGTTIVVSVGTAGGIFAAYLGGTFPWRTSYLVGGVMGLALLLLRVGVYESGMFEALKQRSISRGNFLSLFSSWKRASKYLTIILIGTPVWYTGGILMTFLPELARAMGMTTAPKVSTAFLIGICGSVIGNVACGLLGQLLHSRRKAIFVFLLILATAAAAFFLIGPRSVNSVYLCCFFLQVGSGYWSVFVTSACEQFGTNIRATVTTTVPNFVRSTLILMTAAFRLEGTFLGLPGSAILVGCVSLLLAALALWRLEETYGKDLDYIES